VKNVFGGNRFRTNPGVGEGHIFLVVLVAVILMNLNSGRKEKEVRI
jgi:hypothetical protein